MMRVLFTLVGATLLAPPAMAAKQPLAGAPDDLAVQAVHNFAACIVDTTPQGAIQLLELDYRSPDYAKKMSRLTQGHADSRCMSPSIMRSSQVLLAGGMAERLLVEKVKPGSFPGLVAYDAAKPPVEARSMMEMVSLCVIRAEPVKTRAIFDTDPATPAESHAMQAIAPALTGCVPAGRKIELNKPGLRASLALASYRLLQQGPVAPAYARPTLENVPR